MLLLTCVEEEGRRGGGEAPWRGRGELLRGAMLKLAEEEGDGADRWGLAAGKWGELRGAGRAG